MRDRIYGVEGFLFDQIFGPDAASYDYSADDALNDLSGLDNKKHIVYGYVGVSAQDECGRHIDYPYKAAVEEECYQRVAACSYSEI